MSTKTVSTSRRALRLMRTRAAILDAAIGLFSEQGYDETPIADIARRADVGVGTVYGYFAAKDDLLLGAVEHLSIALRTLLLEERRRREGAPWLERFVRILEAQSQFMNEHRAAFLAAYPIAARHRPRVFPFESLVRFYEDTVTEGIRLGECRPVPVGTSARLLMTAFTASTLGLGPWADVPGEAVRLDELSGLVTSMLAPQEGEDRHPLGDAHQAKGSEDAAE